jgi:hypothetical protein
MRWADDVLQQPLALALSLSLAETEVVGLLARPASASPLRQRWRLAMIYRET